MEQTVITFLIAAFIGCLWLLRCAFEFGKASERQDMYNGRSPAQQLPTQTPLPTIIEDKPAEQAGFVFMHENFIDDPPLETKE